MSISFPRLARLSAALLLTVAVSGCSTVYKTTGWFAYDYAESHAIPFTMRSDDPTMVCNQSQALAETLLSFSDVTYEAHLPAVTLYMMAGSCAEADAHEHALAYLRAFNGQQVAAAKDARILEKRGYAIAAQRQYNAYQHMVAELGEPGGNCPELNDDEQIYWVLGILAGVQSVMSDLRAEGSVGVPKDIAMKSVRGMQCVDNQRWWGLPQAVQASVWVMLPDNAPAGVDPWQQLQQASAMASDAGVRMAHAIEVTIADSSGDPQRLRDAIRRHADSVNQQSAAEQYRLMDIMAQRQILAISDRMWTEATGARTPFGQLGTFWDDQTQSLPAFDIDDLLGAE
ncbi:hypothetical protein CHH28_10240 [Bacterioplanes sanyensis]|uniref:Imelysin-like domain-containing protein n=1 Tax=Bacterioplanes sanyensis TaxID=1249553 RepID=A0A222FLD9_9GAMM|nr:hypothetical protein [Bacterioplanes sanyensis]ASP39033.1 hypothetical protein CHH28_10240 [Bacterioplanes sanyensis]